MQVYAGECTYRHLNGVQEVASSNLAAPIGLNDGSVDNYGRVVFLAICNSNSDSDGDKLVLAHTYLIQSSRLSGPHFAHRVSFANIARSKVSSLKKRNP